MEELASAQRTSHVQGCCMSLICSFCVRVFGVYSATFHADLFACLTHSAVAFVICICCVRFGGADRGVFHLQFVACFMRSDVA